MQKSWSNKLLSFFCLFFFCISGLIAQEPAKINAFAPLRRQFFSPPQQYGTTPFFVWNSRVDTAQISWMMKEYKANDFGGVIIHPRAGLVTPYLSKEWLDMYRFSVQRAKELKMDIWIYDENSYPSGFGGGLVPAQMPESYNQGEMLEFKKSDTLPAETNPYYLILKKAGDQYINITGSVSKEKEKNGSYFLFKKTFYNKSPWYGGYSYVDLMAKGVTEKFLEVTMGPYKKVIGDEFGKTVRGVFSDEPNIEIQNPNSMRWTPDLFSRFHATWGYDLQVHLPELFEETGEWKKIRHNYYQTLLQLFIDRWSIPFSSYTRAKKLEWTGHYWEHEWPSPNHGPDNMAMYAWPQRPGIDMLFNQFNEEDVNAQFGNIRSVKELASVANQLNKRRVLSETYGGAGWELRFEDMKRFGDWEFALGINSMNQHLSYMSLLGARKYDWPQSFSYQTPWWPYYKYLAKYYSRLTMVLASGDQYNELLIIEPTTTAWMYYNYDHQDTVFKWMGNQFQKFITRLEHAQVEYDLGSENIIRDHGKIEQGKFIIGFRKYKTVVLPESMENLDMPTFLLLKKFAESGGRIVQYSQIKTINGAESPLLEEFYKKNYPGLIKEDSLNDAGILKYFRNGDFNIHQIQTGDLYHYRRKVKDGEIVFISNASLDHASKGTLTMKGADVLLMDLFAGNIFTYPHTSKGNMQMAEYDIPPAGSRLFFFPKEKKSGYLPYKQIRIHGKTIDVPTKVQCNLDNSLSIDFCDLKIGDTIFRDQHVYNAADRVFKYYGFNDGDPWNTSVQYKDNTINRDHFAKGTGFTAIYYFNIAEEINLNTLKAVVENPGLYTVKLNDHVVLPDPVKFWVDKGFRVFEIGKYLHAGINNISISADPMSVYAEIEPVYILGKFGLTTAGKGWDIIKEQDLKLGSWKSMGMPMYGQQVSYTKEINIVKKPVKQWLVQLDQWKGTVATVSVNKKFAGIIALAPYTFDITPFLNNGNNSIEINVIGSLKNVFGPFHNNPKPGFVSPWSFRYVVGHPPGKAYDLIDYGLFNDFKVIVQ